jgi:SAM-dependent methyltransferase
VPAAGDPAPVDLPQGPAARRWSSRLAAWAIPRSILAQAPRSPWWFPPGLFRTPRGPALDTPSTGLARVVLPPSGGTVLDVGCGGGRASMALAPPAEHVIGVDRDARLLAAFRAVADERGVACTAVLGEWPAAARDVHDADVVICHHVAYDVPDLGAFALALGTRARRRVVLELRQEHPLVWMAPLWRQFWDLERPTGPTAPEALAVLREVGLPAGMVTWQEAPDASRLRGLPFEQQVEIARIRLCLPAERDPEIADAMRALGPPLPREVATIWWEQVDGRETRRDM